MLLAFFLVSAFLVLAIWINENKLTVDPVKVVAKRSDVKASHVQKTNDFTTVTTYYVTFEYGSHEREEFVVPENEYGLIAINDKGSLSHRGNVYVIFERSYKKLETR